MHWFFSKNKELQDFKFWAKQPKLAVNTASRAQNHSKLKWKGKEMDQKFATYQYRFSILGLGRFPTPQIFYELSFFSSWCGKASQSLYCEVDLTFSEKKQLGKLMHTSFWRSLSWLKYGSNVLGLTSLLKLVTQTIQNESCIQSQI